MKAKKVVAQAFDKKDVIDYLFISHLDYDQISLVITLIDSVKSESKNQRIRDQGDRNFYTRFYVPEKCV